MKATILTIILLTTSVLSAEDAIQEKILPCRGKISAISTANLIEYHSFLTENGTSLYGCDNNGRLRLHDDSIAGLTDEELFDLEISYLTI